MMMNNMLCDKLTPDYVNTATGLELHQFKWLKNEDAIGNIPLDWNWLVTEYEYNEKAKNVHWTLVVLTLKIMLEVITLMNGLIYITIQQR